MISPDAIVDGVVALCRANAALVAAMGGSATKIEKLAYAYPEQPDLTRAIWRAQAPAMLVYWHSTREGSFGQVEALKHEIRIAIKPPTAIEPVFVAFREGVPAGSAAKFKFLSPVVVAGVDCLWPAESLSISRLTQPITQDAYIDYFEISIIYSERGLDA